jgi:hypothetical protein
MQKKWSAQQFAAERAPGAGVLLAAVCLLTGIGPLRAQAIDRVVSCDGSPTALEIAGHRQALPVYVAPGEPETLQLAADLFAGDVEKVTGLRPRVVHSLDGVTDAIVLATVDHVSAPLQSQLALDSLRGKWESAQVTTLDHALPGLHHALFIVGSDRRGAAYALLQLSRGMGVSPWNWWADVPVQHRDAVCVSTGSSTENEPSVRYRGIFLNDEDWGLRPWAAKRMDPDLHNIGPHTYERIFELMLRLRANLLWPAMHPGTLAFNAVAENAQLAGKWGIVMGSSHSEALLRNNVGEWDPKRDGPWNYQTNRTAIDAFWNQRLKENGRYENFYTVGMRGRHDSGLEATGTAEDKARLVEQAMASQRAMLAQQVNPQVEKIPQIVWLYKESLELYRAGMKVPDDVTLGWTDDNYGYIRQLSTAAEQKRPGGSGLYYHVSYWGAPHDYLWLCTTPPSLMREELTKAYDHGARRVWVLNVGDLKPAELNIDYFLQLAWDEPRLAAVAQQSFLEIWYGEQFSPAQAAAIAQLASEAYRLNFIRKPEFMGFNGYNDGINRTDFNPLAWGDQNRQRIAAWQQLAQSAEVIGKHLPVAQRDAYFELIGYPIATAAAQNEKLLWTDRAYLDASLKHAAGMEADKRKANDAFAQIGALTEQYNQLAGGKWDGMMDFAPRNRKVFKMPALPTGNEAITLPDSWRAAEPASSSAHGPSAFREIDGVVSINAVHFSAHQDGDHAAWQILGDLGISGDSIAFGAPGRMDFPAQLGARQPWVEYRFDTASDAPARLEIYLLPTFAVDADHRLRYTVQIDDQQPQQLDLSGAGEWHENNAPEWSANVLRNAAIQKDDLGRLAPGTHRLRLTVIDPGLVFEHIVVHFPAAAPAYPVPPETQAAP